jgi:hypothetical protein
MTGRLIRPIGVNLYTYSQNIFHDRSLFNHLFFNLPPLANTAINSEKATMKHVMFKPSSFRDYRTTEEALERDDYRKLYHLLSVIFLTANFKSCSRSFTDCTNSKRYSLSIFLPAEVL